MNVRNILRWASIVLESTVLGIRFYISGAKYDNDLVPLYTDVIGLV